MLVRPSYVLGGRAMVIAYDEEMVRQYMREAVTFSQDRPVLVDRFLEDATEVDVDALGDGENVLIAGIMEHIEEAGVHSGDSSCVLPAKTPHAASNSPPSRTTPCGWRKALNVIGLMNVQYAIQNGTVYVLEVNPRASRTVPYVSKATGVPLPKIAVGLMLGKKLTDFADLTGGRVSGVLPVPQDFVKSPVFPFNKFPGVDPALGPEMRSTGEVMGVGENFGEAFAKAQISAGTPLPDKGTVFFSVNDHHKPEAVEVARRFAAHGLQAGGHARHRRRAARRRPAMQDRLQGERGPPQRGGPAQGGKHPTGHLHHHGRAGVLRREGHPPQRGDVPRPLHHHHERREGGGRRRGRPPARPHPGVEPTGNPRASQRGGVAGL